MLPWIVTIRQRISGRLKASAARLLALGGVIQTALLAFPDKLLQYIPSWVLQGLSVFALGCIIIAGYVTATKQEHPS